MTYKIDRNKKECPYCGMVVDRQTNGFFDVFCRRCKTKFEQYRREV